MHINTLKGTQKRHLHWYEKFTKPKWNFGRFFYSQNIFESQMTIIPFFLQSLGLYIFAIFSLFIIFVHSSLYFMYFTVLFFFHVILMTLHKCTETITVHKFLLLLRLFTATDNGVGLLVSI